MKKVTSYKAFRDCGAMVKLSQVRITNSMAYGTRRFNAALTKALQ